MVDRDKTDRAPNVDATLPNTERSDDDYIDDLERAFNGLAHAVGVTAGESAQAQAPLKPPTPKAPLTAQASGPSNFVDPLKQTVVPPPLAPQPTAKAPKPQTPPQAPPISDGFRRPTKAPANANSYGKNVFVRATDYILDANNFRVRTLIGVFGPVLLASALFLGWMLFDRIHRVSRFENIEKVNGLLIQSLEALSENDKEEARQKVNQAFGLLPDQEQAKRLSSLSKDKMFEVPVKKKTRKRKR